MFNHLNFKAMPDPVVQPPIKGTPPEGDDNEGEN